MLHILHSNNAAELLHRACWVLMHLLCMLPATQAFNCRPHRELHSQLLINGPKDSLQIGLARAATETPQA